MLDNVDITLYLSTYLSLACSLLFGHFRWNPVLCLTVCLTDWLTDCRRLPLPLARRLRILLTFVSYYLHTNNLFWFTNQFNLPTFALFYFDGSNILNLIIYPLFPPWNLEREGERDWSATRKNNLLDSAFEIDVDEEEHTKSKSPLGSYLVASVLCSLLFLVPFNWTLVFAVFSFSCYYRVNLVLSSYTH